MRYEKPPSKLKKAFCYQKFLVFSVERLKFLSIYRTFSSQNRSEQFWQQNTISFKGTASIFYENIVKFELRKKRRKGRTVVKRPFFILTAA